MGPHRTGRKSSTPQACAGPDCLKRARVYFGGTAWRAWGGNSMAVTGRAGLALTLADGLRKATTYSDTVFESSVLKCPDLDALM